MTSENGPEADFPEPNTPPSPVAEAVPHGPNEIYHHLVNLLGEQAARRLGVYPIPEELILSVVMPVYNEEHTLEEIVRRVRSTGLKTEVVIVDDASTDGTGKVLERLEALDGVRVFRHEKNQGKGAALRTGFKQVQGDVVIVQDADLEYDPGEYIKLIQPIVEGVADVVYGSRFLTTGPQRVLYYWHSVGNRLLTLMSNMFTDLNLTDMETCYKVFRREVIDEIGPKLRQNRFGCDPEITAKIARRGYRIYERGISYFGRTYQEGKKIGWRDAITVFFCILRYCRWD